MYPLLETIKIYHGKVVNLYYHQTRMDKAYQEYYNKKNPFKLKQLIQPGIHHSFGIVKCRLMYNAENFSIDYKPYKSKQINTLKIIRAYNLDYHLKYTDRSGINALLEQKEACDDILIIKDGCISDTSYANIAFLKAGKWITPDTPLLAGTKRQSLIDKKILVPKRILIKDLNLFSGFRLVNAMLSFDGQFIKPVKNISY